MIFTNIDWNTCIDTTISILLFDFFCVSRYFLTFCPWLFNLRSPKTILWSFVMYSGTTADFGRPERSASSVFVRLRLNSSYQSIIVNFPGAESPNAYQDTALINSIFPIKKQCLINTRNSLLSIVLKITKVAPPKPLQL